MPTIVGTSRGRVNSPTGKVYHCDAEYTNVSSTTCQIILCEEVMKQTGVPMDLQMLFSCGKLIPPRAPLCEYSLVNGCCLTLIVKGLGGGGGTTDSPSGKKACILTTFNSFYKILESEEEIDECTSCGERTYAFCEDCTSSRCKTCDEQWHKHPKRQGHQKKVLLLLTLILISVIILINKLKPAGDKKASDLVTR